MRWMAIARQVLTSRWVRIGFAGAVVVFLTLAALDQWHRIGPRLHDISVATLVLGLLAVVVGLVATMFAWKTLLTELGADVRVAAIWRVFFAGQLGKYVPGSVWPVVMQMELGANYGIPRQTAATATVVQMGLTVATGALTAAATLPFVLSSSVSELAWVPLIIVVSVVALHPRVANPVLNFGFRRLHRPPLDKMLSWRGLLTAAAFQAVGIVLFSVPVVLLAHDLGGSGGRLVVLGIGAFALSWVIGFLFVVAPAGAGIRETLMVAILGASITSASALTVALLSRLVMTVGDVLVGGLALGAAGRSRLLRQRRPQPADEITPPIPPPVHSRPVDP